MAGKLSVLCCHLRTTDILFMERSVRKQNEGEQVVKANVKLSPVFY
jgi:hypothetical protein